MSIWRYAHMGVQCMWGTVEGAGTLGSGVPGSCELPESWELITSPLLRGSECSNPRSLLPHPRVPEF